ncbi:MAG: translation initiation factor IF-2 [Puniceicoccales bacterium]|jgi:translation initiation factor IF-2|nr:translation initiation factor IF-2 [Puniceicoccales bacterium]
MSKRANEIAKELGISNNEAVALINERYPELGVKTHSNTVPTPYLDGIMAHARERLAEIQNGTGEPLIPEAPKAPKARRVNEIAKELGLASAVAVPAIQEKFPQLGVKSHSNSIPGDNVAEVVAYLAQKFKAAQAAPPAKAPPAPQVPAKPVAPAPPAPAKSTPVPPASPAPAQAADAGVASAPKPPPSAANVAKPAPGVPPPLRQIPRPPAHSAGSPPPLSASKLPPPAPVLPRPPHSAGAPAGALPPAAQPAAAPGNPPPPAPPAAQVAPRPPVALPSARFAGSPPPLSAAKLPPPVPALPRTPPPAAGRPAEPVPPPPVVRTGISPASAPGVPAPVGQVRVPPPAVKTPPPLPPRVRPSAPPPLPGQRGPFPPPPIPGGTAAAGPRPPAVPQPAETLTPLVVRPPIVVRDFAIALNLRPFRLISELMEMGIFASISQSIDEAVAVRIAKKYGVALEVKHRGEAAQPPKPAQVKVDHDDPALCKPRPPVVCVLGHVDHGKTTLLDFYRKTSVVSGEAGGITQHVGAYTVVHDGKRITFLDTPGHAAFSKMRERGAEITDIAILVVAADDGFMPQTDEALKFAQKNNVQIVVAINKMDAKGASVDRVKQQMQQRGIASEDWGGTILTSPVSALKGDGMDGLLESILLQAEVMDLKANPSRPAEGTIIEAQMETGRGPTATVIVQKGTLRPGDAIVCGRHYCKVRALFDDRGKALKEAPPGNPALMLGWSGVPVPGAVFQACKNEKEARALAEENEQNLRKALEEEADSVRAEKSRQLGRMDDMARLMAAIAQTKDKVFKVLCKSDVNGTLEALVSCLEGINQTTDKVKLEIVASGVGPITPNDVNVAHAAGATIVAFDVKHENGVPALLKRNGVRVITHDIIYMLLDLVREAMAALLDPVYRENRVGMAEIRVIFPHGKSGHAAGCMVSDGRIQRDFKARLHRGRQIIHSSTIDTLKRFKDDVTEVKSGYECGIRLDGCDDYKEGDMIECYEILEERPSL